MNTASSQHSEKSLREKLHQDPSDWETRRMLAHTLYDGDLFSEAAEVIWAADEIPSTDLDLAFAAKILSKTQPRKAIRLLTAVLELNKGKGVQNMGMANALLHHGLVLQAARFYGAALEADPELVNPDLEHFILWTDDEMWLWGVFKDRRPKLGELPWMARDPMEALKLTSKVSVHTTPVSVPRLTPVNGEELQHEMYQQEASRNGRITPPPAVTIPIDRVDPKDRIFDSTYGAEVVRQAPAQDVAAAQTPVPAEASPAPAAIPVATPVPAAAPAPAAVPAPAASTNYSPSPAPNGVLPGGGVPILRRATPVTPLMGAAKPPLPPLPANGLETKPLQPPPRAIPKAPEAASLDPNPRQSVVAAVPSAVSPGDQVQPPTGALPPAGSALPVAAAAPILIKRLLPQGSGGAPAVNRLLTPAVGKPTEEP